MAGIIQYQPLTGPVWREPVAASLAWLPRGEPARPLERRSLGESVYPPFYELYNPAGLHWLPSGRWPLYPEIRKLGDFQQPPFQALYKPEQLGWMSPAYYVGRAAPRGTLDLTVEPIQFAAPAFDPQDLEWIPKGTPPGTLSEIRKLGDFAQPAFDALYRPEGLQWLFEGQLSVRGIPYTIQSSWVVDPNPIVVAPFDPQFFQFQATDIILARALQRAIQSDFASPPLPPGPDVIPPAQPGGGEYQRFTMRPRNVFIQRYVHDLQPIDEIIEPETVFLGAVEKTIAQAEAASSPIHQEIGLLSALATLSEAYGAHFDSAKAAKAAIEQRKGELIDLDEEEIIAMMMIIAATDDST